MPLYLSEGSDSSDSDWYFSDFYDSSTQRNVTRKTNTGYGFLVINQIINYISPGKNPDLDPVRCPEISPPITYI